MDYKEEQDGEMEALEAIYSEELTVVSREPYTMDVLVSGSNEGSRDDFEICLSCKLRFTFVETYPDAPPVIEVVDNSVEGNEFDDEKITKLCENLEDVANENLGMVMIFTLVSAAQDILLQFVDEIKKEMEEKKQAEYAEAKRLEELKYKGTPVTLENFLAWKIRFDEEMRAAGKRIINDPLAKKASKLTGRLLFERDSSMNVSDMQFLQQDTGVVAAGGVKVDESLFQDLDDLDLDDLDGLEDE